MNPTAQLLEPEIRELVEEGRYAELREALLGIPAVDVAEILSELDAGKAAVAFRFLARDFGGEVFSHFPPEKQNQLIKKLGTADSAQLLEAMSADDRARVVDELPPEVAARIVAELPPEERKVTQAILGYPPRSVGRLMTPDYVRIRPEWTVSYALDHIRRYGRDAETLNVVYVIDEQGKLVDDVRLRGLLLADPSQTVESLMNRSFVSLQADQPQADAVQLLKRYDRSALPVVDSRGALLGIVTHDDVADVAEREATEQVQKLAGVQALEQPYTSAGQVELFKKRGPWLGLLLVGQTITILVLGSFQDKLERATILTLFLPLVISCGGNSGSQAATLITRALALGEIDPGDWWRIVRKELVIGLLLGGMLSFLGLCAVRFFTGVGYTKTDEPLLVSLTVSGAVLLIVVWAVLLGSTLPLALKRAGVDPATASSPLVATLMDASGTLIYLAVAVALLTGTVL
jgi:magnesium transporter